MSYVYMCVWDRPQNTLVKWLCSRCASTSPSLWLEFNRKMAEAELAESSPTSVQVEKSRYILLTNIMSCLHGWGRKTNVG